MGAERKKGWEGASVLGYGGLGTKVLEAQEVGQERVLGHQGLGTKVLEAQELGQRCTRAH